MNKRARTRLIGITAIILIIIAAAFMASGNKTAAYYKTVKQAATDKKLVGDRVKVGGAVVDGSWDKKSNPMTFSIRDENDKANKGPVIKVVYEGSVPSTFGDGVVAIVTGKLDANNLISADEMITKCPSKYQSAAGAMPVQDLKPGQKMAEVQVSGYVKPGSIVPPGSTQRFIVAEKADGTGAQLAVSYDGALPSGMTDSVKVVVTGAVSGDGKATAKDVAISK